MKTRFKKIDLHIHACSLKRIPEFIRYCDQAGLSYAGLVSLPDSKRGTFNHETITTALTSPKRFKAFGCLDYRYSRTEKEGVRQIENLKKLGFSGLKLWIGKPEASKMFNINLEDSFITGALKASSNLEMPVLLHLADPPDFWEKDAEGRVIYNQSYGSFNDWINRGRGLFSKFPNLDFIGAHLLFLAGEIDNLNEILREHDNLKIDTAPGRWFFNQLSLDKKKARAFFIRWKKRIILGSDSMFFPKDFSYFPFINLKQNIKSLKNIESLLSKDGIIDDPYSRNKSNKKNNKISCLNLEENIVENIFYNNAYQYFK